MINTGYFTPKAQIISWINCLLAIEMTKIEQLGSGSIYCQILDAAYPEKVPLHKVKWNAYLQTDFIHNMKILQTAFDHLGIQKYIDIQKLVKAKYQDNLEFIQWMKWKLEQKITGGSYYDAESRRNHAKINLAFCESKKFELTLSTHRDKENLNQSFCHSTSNKLNSSCSTARLSNETHSKNALNSSMKRSTLGKTIDLRQKPNDLREKKSNSLHIKIHKPEKPIKCPIEESKIIEDDQECF